LNLAQRFQRIRDTNLWGAEATASGLGSEIDATTVLRGELPRLLKKLGVASLLDAPAATRAGSIRPIWVCVMQASTS
jgi:hypothetical protein